LAKHRSGNWQKLNAFGHIGGGISWYDATNKSTTLVMPLGVSLEYNISPCVAVSITGDRRTYSSTSMGIRNLNERAAIWGISAGVRIKFGKSHIRNVRAVDYDASFIETDPIYDDTALLNTINENAQRVNDLQNQLNNALLQLDQCCAANANPVITKVYSDYNDDSDYVPPTDFPNIEFEPGKYQISATAKPILDALEQKLKENPTLKLEIIGHTDSSGGEIFNEGLALHRASVVKDYLVTKGIDSTRIALKGFSHKHPVSPNTSEEGRKHNRRAECRLIW
jgi:outer membrane protein OmpA-like peptidoglycan-associated protein